jgi:hypothetical protein
MDSTPQLSEDPFWTLVTAFKNCRASPEMVVKAKGKRLCDLQLFSLTDLTPI